VHTSGRRTRRTVRFGGARAIAVAAVTLGSLFAFVFVGAPTQGSSTAAPSGLTSMANAVEVAAGPAAGHGILPNRPSGVVAPLIWSDVTNGSAPSPGSLLGPSMAYDPVARADVLFGGSNLPPWLGEHDLNGTWSYSSAGWSLLHPATAPLNTSGATFAYDPDVNALVLVSPDLISSESNGPAATWEFHGGVWTELSRASVGGPPGTSFGAMAYDPTAHALLRYGGRQLGAVPYRDQLSNATWVFENGTWTNVTASNGPPVLVAPSLSYDPTLRGVLLYGGVTSNGYVTWATNQTWLWSNGTWAKLAPATSPPHVAAAALAWDPELGTMILAGGATGWFLGSGGGAGSANGTYSFANGNWSSLTPIAAAPPGGAISAAGTDPTSGGLLLYPDLQATAWVLNRAPGSEITALRSATDVGVPVLLQDPLASTIPNEVVVWTFGDGSNSASPTTTHAFSAPGTYTVNLTSSATIAGVPTISWAQFPVAIAADPSPQVTLAKATVDVNGVANAAATVGGGIGPYTVNWTFGDGAGDSGIWSVHHQFRTVGDFPIRANVTDSVGVTAEATAVVHVQPFPRVDLQVSQATYDLGQSVRLTAATENGSSPFSFVYVGLPPGCSTANVSNYTCRPTDPGRYDVQVTVLDAGGLHVTSGLTLVTIAPPLSGTLSVSARTIDLGTPITIGAVFASEGSGNISVNFSTGLSCQALSGFDQLCLPDVAGTYTLSGVATDLSGATDPLGLSVLVVNPPLGIVASAPATPVVRGTPVLLGVSVAGGTPPFQVEFANVPHGCTPMNATTFRCDLQLVGTFAFSGSVTDALGATASTHVEVYVTAPASGGGPSPTVTSPPPSSTDYVFWGLVLAAAVQIALSIRYSRRPARRRWEEAGRIRKGLWSVFGSAALDVADADAISGADAPP
jgi:PKD repeat protein